MRMRTVEPIVADRLFGALGRAAIHEAAARRLIIDVVRAIRAVARGDARFAVGVGEAVLQRRAAIGAEALVARRVPEGQARVADAHRHLALHRALRLEALLERAEVSGAARVLVVALIDASLIEAARATVQQVAASEVV